MAVALTFSKTIGGAAASDSLAGGGSGVDLGSVVNGEYAPIISKTLNSGWQPLYIQHDGNNKITDVATFIDEYSQTYGGADSAADDFATLKAKGNASDNSANNSTGLSSGLRVEQDADLAGSLGLSAFDGTRGQVKIYGKTNLGIDLASAFVVHADAMVYDNSGTAVDASAPVAGEIGELANTVLGDTAFLKLRLYLEEAAATGGIIQWDFCVKYSYSD
jgi:hypothetical protein